MSRLSDSIKTVSKNILNITGANQQCIDAARFFTTETTMSASTTFLPKYNASLAKCLTQYNLFL